MRLLLAVTLCFLSGSALVSCCWRRARPLLTDLLLRACLAFGLGIAIFSAVFFLGKVLEVSRFLFVDLAGWAGLSVVCLIRSPKMSAPPALDHGRQADWPRWFVRALAAAFAIALSGAVCAATVRMKALAHGEGWDAFAIWNLHARFLFLGGSHWRDGFTTLLPGSHPDYPLLLPAAIAHFWTYLGWDDPRVPAVIGLVFGLATVGVLFASLAIVQGKVPAMLAATALLATPFFIEQATAQYADVPLGFFYLTTIVLLCLGDKEVDRADMGASGFLLLAGLSAGFAAWTKNEGLLFLCAVMLSRALCVCWWRKRAAVGLRWSVFREGRSAWAPLLVGILPVGLLVAYFKHSIAPASELFAERAALFHKLLDPGRYWAILRWYGKDFLRFGHWLLIPGTLLLVGLVVAAEKNHDRARRPGFRTSVLALALTLAGYFAIYVITPYDLYWHLRFSLARLFLQLWPSALFLTFLAVRVRAEPAESRT